VVTYLIKFGHDSHTEYTVSVDDAFRWTNLTPCYIAEKDVLRAKLVLISNFYQSRFGHAFDFDLLLTRD
jgi:hypothetical protein